METQFPWFPVTMERPERPLASRITITNAAYRNHDANEVSVEDDYSAHEYGIAVIDLDTPEEFRFRTEEDEPIILRATRPDDAAADPRFSLRIDLPVDIIGAIMTNTTSQPSISAAVDDTGEVHTMVLETGVGLYARFSRSWIRMADISPIEQLDIIDVPPDDVEAYDQADDRGQTLNIRDLHPIEQPAVSGISVTPEPAAVTAGAQFGATVLISSAADLPDAIAQAATEEGAGTRWYVARRARALGYTEPMPWEAE